MNINDDFHILNNKEVLSLIHMKKKIISLLLCIFFQNSLFSQNNTIVLSSELFLNKDYSHEMFPNQSGLYRNNAGLYTAFNFSRKFEKFDFIIKPVANEDDFFINQVGIKFNLNNHFIKFGILPYVPARANDFVLSDHGEPFLSFQFGSIKNIVFNNKVLKPFFLKYDFVVGQLNSRGSFIHEIDYGDFIDSEYLIQPFLHKKTLEVGYKFRENQLLLGFTHGVMFGGKIQKGDGIITPNRSFRAFTDALLLKSSGGSYYTADPNVEGNHLGFWSIGFYRKDFEIYINKIFDDGSGLWLNNRLDGIWGLNFKPQNEKIEMINIELTTTKYQSGNTHIAGKGSGVDSYYWHHIYTSGWYINNLSLGHSLISPYNNRMHALKLSTKYNLNNNDYLSLTSYIIDRFKHYGPKGTVEGVIFDSDDAQRVYIGNLNFSKKLKESRLIFSLGYKVDEIKLMNYKIKFEKELIF
tara:strand:+ start:15505 stop:16905 length:1401 start_codon:yes stop_codon:yes gene_type:complete